jgi:cytochrome P450
MAATIRRSRADRQLSYGSVARAAAAPRRVDGPWLLDARPPPGCDLATAGRPGGGRRFSYSEKESAPGGPNRAIVSTVSDERSTIEAAPTEPATAGDPGPGPAALLFTPEVRADPFPFYRHLLEHDPVHDTGFGLWLLSSYDDCRAALRDPRFSAEFRTMSDYEASMAAIGRDTPVQALMERLMLFRDAPDHTRLRSLVQRAFSPRMVESFRARVAEVAEDLLDQAEARGELELMSDFAWPLPVIVIAEMLGVPASERERFRGWASDLALAFDLGMTPERSVRAEAAQIAFTDFFLDLIRERAREPRGDLLTAMVEAEEQGDRLSPDELVSNLVLLLIAGHETTMNLIGNGTLALLRNPEQLARLRDDPLIAPDAVEELLRYESPVQLVIRFPREDVEVGGKLIPKGARVMLLLGAANHDPARFADPDVLDLGRGDRGHLSFGGGPHFCLGNALARMEGEVAIPALLRRFPDLALADPDPAYRPTMTLRGLEALRLTC